MKRTRKTLITILSLAILLTTMQAGTASAQQTSPEQYIEQYKDIAVRYMEEHGCPASLILAIAIHESAYGTSRVARYLNNHFGIKGPNNSKEIRSAYKGYSSVEESYADFIGLLKRRKKTQVLFDQYQPHQYREWVRGVARSGYAHSASWPAKVIGMIERYGLHELDNRPADGTVLASAVETEGPEPYTVRKGDTLYDIARKYGTTVDAIRRNNDLKGEMLQIGQQLIL